MKNRIYRSLKQIFIVLFMCTALLSGPVTGREVSKMLECMDGQREAQIREFNEAENEEMMEKNLRENHMIQ